MIMKKTNKTNKAFKLSIKKGDKVKVIAGSDKGRESEVLFVDTKKLKIKVKGVRTQSYTDKKTGQRATRESVIDYSNVKKVK